MKIKNWRKVNNLGGDLETYENFKGKVVYNVLRLTQKSKGRYWIITYHDNLSFRTKTNAMKFATIYMKQSLSMGDFWKLYHSLK